MAQPLKYKDAHASCTPCTRFIRVIKWASPQAAIKRLEATLKWRREFGIYDTVTASHVEPEVRVPKKSASIPRSLTSALGHRRL